MAKIYKVESCRECPNLEEWGSVKKNYECADTRLTLETPNDIPEWCDLEDYPDE